MRRSRQLRRLKPTQSDGKSDKEVCWNIMRSVHWCPNGNGRMRDNSDTVWERCKYTGLGGIVLFKMCSGGSG